ncbi:FIG146085: 3'-to-5' oligoribonuclease A, Bacillus type [hydrothermal vent metagenome]|uniref:FIG146085: 3'-to-5' oligoribonuclease A, Bacillus type n=1 Tax=hydrothermal vent metagenome TaxID=652676 RepID=A0A1W1B9Z7_9ZZZZ
MKEAKEFLDMIKEASYIAVVAHKDPDADSLGSASAIYSFCLQLHKKVSFVCVSEIQRHFFILPWVDRIKHSFGSEDLLIVCDAASWERVGLDKRGKVINIDHHITNKHYGDLNIIKDDAIATTEVVYDLFRELDVKINEKMATALYAGVVDDSDSFSSSKTDSATFALAKELIELGAKHKDVVKYLQKYSTLSHLRLLGAMLLDMRLLKDATIALFEVEYVKFKRYGADYEDAKEALERALELPTVKTSILILEKEDGSIKISLRSCEVDCASVAIRFGGGGHSERAGCEFGHDVSIQEAREKILEEVKRVEKKKR